MYIYTVLSYYLNDPLSIEVCSQGLVKPCPVIRQELGKDRQWRVRLAVINVMSKA